MVSADLRICDMLQLLLLLDLVIDRVGIISAFRVWAEIHPGRCVYCMG